MRTQCRTLEYVHHCCNMRPAQNSMFAFSGNTSAVAATNTAGHVVDDADDSSATWTIVSFGTPMFKRPGTWCAVRSACIRLCRFVWFLRAPVACAFYHFMMHIARSHTHHARTLTHTPTRCHQRTAGKLGATNLQCWGHCHCRTSSCKHAPDCALLADVFKRGQLHYRNRWERCLRGHNAWCVGLGC